MNWARKVAGDASSTSTDDIDGLKAVGLTDREIFGITALVAFRMAFSSVNAAVGSHPDLQLSEAAPSEVRDAAVGFGRPRG